MQGTLLNKEGCSHAAPLSNELITVPIARTLGSLWLFTSATERTVSTFFNVFVDLAFEISAIHYRHPRWWNDSCSANSPDNTFWVGTGYQSCNVIVGTPTLPVIWWLHCLWHNTIITATIRIIISAGFPQARTSVSLAAPELECLPTSLNWGKIPISQ